MKQHHASECEEADIHADCLLKRPTTPASQLVPIIAVRYIARMLTYLRYALATLCFVLSVGCLGLYWRSYSQIYRGPIRFSDLFFDLPQEFAAQNGIAVVGTLQTQQDLDSEQRSRGYGKFRRLFIRDYIYEQGIFGTVDQSAYFPIWYPALALGCAGIAALRLGRFTLRSAMIATTVVAGLLGMVVAL